MVSQRRAVVSPDVVDDAQGRLARTDTAHRLAEASDLWRTAMSWLCRRDVVMVVVMVVMVSPVAGRPPRCCRLADLLDVGVVRRRRRGVVLVAPQVARYS